MKIKDEVCRLLKSDGFNEAYECLIDECERLSLLGDEERIKSDELVGFLYFMKKKKNELDELKDKISLHEGLLGDIFERECQDRISRAVNALVELFRDVNIVKGFLELPSLEGLGVKIKTDSSCFVKNFSEMDGDWFKSMKNKMHKFLAGNLREGSYYEYFRLAGCDLSNFDERFDCLKNEFFKIRGVCDEVKNHLNLLNGFCREYNLIVDELFCLVSKGEYSSSGWVKIHIKDYCNHKKIIEKFDFKNLYSDAKRVVPY